jgi:hypothetical protein
MNRNTSVQECDPAILRDRQQEKPDQGIMFLTKLNAALKTFHFSFLLTL